jgi:hypothetical protein
MDIFDKLRAQLDLMEWPNLYLYKFIIPNENEKLALYLMVKQQKYPTTNRVKETT